MPRIVNHQPFTTYLEEADVNASALRAGRRSMQHMAAVIDGQSKEPTTALRIGTALHCAVLEPMRFEAIATVAPDVDRRTKDGKATYAAWQASLPPNAMVLDADEFAIVRDASTALLSSQFVGMIGKGEPEVSIYWDETVTIQGDPVVIGCKARLDWLGARDGRIVIGDIKTTRDATPRGFSRACATYGYAHQLAWYRRAVRALQSADDGLPSSAPIDIVLGAVETDKPYAVGVYRISDLDLDTADADNMATLTQWASCVRRDIYPGPTDGEVRTIFVPEWAFDTRGTESVARQTIGDINTGDDFDATIPF